MSGDFSRIVVPAPKEKVRPAIKGEGWELRLNAGWSIGADQRKGDLIIRPD
jgi:hypothetical protein